MRPVLNNIKRAVLAVSLLGLAFQASAQTKVDDAWVRATVPTQSAKGEKQPVEVKAEVRALTHMEGHDHSKMH
jgi:hypothetical protein